MPDIQKVVVAAAQHGAATLALPVLDTPRYGDGSYLDRHDLWTLQTPQGFRYGLLREAHAKRRDDVTDDTALITKLGHPVELVSGDRDNIKITTQADWTLAEKIMTARKLTPANVMRTGFGFDVHAFSATVPGPLRLCGITVPHTNGLEGHSDADLGLHALTDAVLGAMADGDIGQHFPSTDMQWKNADSRIFLKYAMSRLRARGGIVHNFDLTIVCESPRVGLYRDAMRAHVAEICNLAVDQISIKGTTSQRLGFTGRSEGIAAQAVVTISLRDD